MSFFYWSKISEIPKKPGVYAWYYKPKISEFDLRETILKIQKTNQENSGDSAHEIIEDFLEKNIFQYFKERPYQSTLFGQLKPKYFGLLEHQSSISSELISRISEKPTRLYQIKKIIENSVPNLASPLYIGMSKELGRRLNEHKKLIEKYRAEPFSLENTNDENQDHSFAKEVCTRNILPDCLFVSVNIIDAENNEYVDIENILNRIYYPLLGKN